MRVLPAFLVILSQVCAGQMQFEVASIKPNISPDRNSLWHITPGGRFTGEHVNLQFLITTVFHIRDSQIAVAPAYLESEKYDIVAEGEGNPNHEQLLTMLQGRLLDRSKLKYHWVTKQLPVYALVPAKNGIKLKAAQKESCEVAVVAPPDTKSDARLFLWNILQPRKSDRRQQHHHGPVH